MSFSFNNVVLEYDETDKTKLRIAKVISTLTNPPILCIPLFLIICILLSSNGQIFTNSFSFNWGQFVILEGISLLFTSILPMAIILYWAKKYNTDKDISNREDRFVPLIVGVLSYFIGFLISFLLNAHYFLTVLLLCYSLNTFIVLLITFKWKISIHTTGLSGPVAALIMLFPPVGIIMGLLYPILIWSRVILKRHTMAQAICGGVQGFILTVVESYLFLALFNWQVYNLTPLIDCLWIILALVGTSIVLAILGYLNDKGLNSIYTRLVFHILGFLTFGFFVLCAPQSALITLILAGPIAILITCYGNNNYSWFRGIARDIDKPNERLYIILSLIFSVIWLVTSWSFFSKEIIVIATFYVAIVNAISKLISIKFGKHKYKVKYLNGDNTFKSFEGSIFVFVVSTLILTILTQNVIVSLFIALVMSVVEVLSPRVIGNLTIPVSIAFLLSFLI